jgi:hypothetical protein
LNLPGRGTHVSNVEQWRERLAFERFHHFTQNPADSIDILT